MAASSNAKTRHARAVNHVDLEIASFLNVMRSFVFQAWEKRLSSRTSKGQPSPFMKFNISSVLTLGIWWEASPSRSIYQSSLSNMWYIKTPDIDSEPFHIVLMKEENLHQYVTQNMWFPSFPNFNPLDDDIRAVVEKETY